MQTKAPFLLLIVIAILAGCGGGGNPEKVVAQLYTALEEGDSDAYMDTLLPKNRNRPDLDGALGMLLGEVGMSAGPVKANLGGLLGPSFVDLNFKTISKKGGHAVVEARGSMRTMMMEFPFCETHDLTREGGRWHIDKFRDEHTARINSLLERNQEHLLALEGAATAGASSSADTDSLDELDAMILGEFTNMFSDFGRGTEIMLDMCE